jgi:hypothetical protein
MGGEYAGKCYPCTWTILLPMYLDYTDASSNNPLQRRPRSEFLMVTRDAVRGPAERRR